MTALWIRTSHDVSFPRKRESSPRLHGGYRLMDSHFPQHVIPAPLQSGQAPAGIQHGRGGECDLPGRATWIPAYARMTALWLRTSHDVSFPPRRGRGRLQRESSPRLRGGDQAALRHIHQRF
jgi:hypothetical protein